MRMRSSLPVTVISRDGDSRRHDQTSVLHALQSNQPAREFLHLRGLAVHNEDFQAGIMVQMRVTGRHHQVVMCVLQFGQLFRYAVGVMIEYQRDCANDSRSRVCRLLGNQAIANQIAEGLGTVRIAEPADEIIEAFEKVGIEGNTDSAEDAHGHSRERGSTTLHGEIAE